jgi:hypothetical protein
MIGAALLHSNVRAALRERLVTVVPAAIIAAQGRVFTPPNPTLPWLRETLQPMASEVGTLGPGARIRHEGIWFLEYFHPIKQGMAAADKDAGVLLDLFPPALVLSHGGQYVTIRRTTRQQERQEVDVMMTPIRVRWFADTFNTI